MSFSESSPDVDALDFSLELEEEARSVAKVCFFEEGEGDGRQTSRRGIWNAEWRATPSGERETQRMGGDGRLVARSEAEVRTYIHDG